MDVQSLSYVKTVVRSILTSKPGNMTISELLRDYVAIEGVHLPYRQLGFRNIYETLQSMNDILKMQPDPNMNSPVELIVPEKTSHLRQLVQGQKTRKPYSKRRPPNLNNNYNSYRNQSCAQNNTAAQRYYMKLKSPQLFPVKGRVTNKLRNDIENLFLMNQYVTVHSLKNYLINHPDYNKMNTSNIEDSVNMLKYFIYIDKNGVHLKNSPNEIFSSKKSNTTNITMIKPNVTISLVDENEEVMIDDNEDEFGMDENLLSSCNDSLRSDSPNEIFSSKKSKTTNITMIKPNVKTNQVDHTENEFRMEENKISICNGLLRSDYRPLKDTFEEEDDNQPSNHNDTIDTQDNNIVDNQSSKTDSIQNKTENVYDKSTILSYHQSKSKKNFKQTQNHIMYKNAIISIISEAQNPITIIEVLNVFKKTFGHDFPLQNFFCSSAMDFFRLYPSLFVIDDWSKISSNIRLAEQLVPKRKISIRFDIMCAALNNYIPDDKLKDLNITQNEVDSELSPNNSSHQQSNEYIDNVHDESYLEYEIYDSDMVLDSMKAKMRCLLTKYKYGIVCDEFMDAYAKEFRSSFVFSEYGFNSMRDMAYKLPSVFYVKVIECNECILFHACRRKELENDPSDSTKIPKDVLHNLSMFFNKHRNGVKLGKMMNLYHSEFHDYYYPLVYGFKSAKQMFKSLDKMVTINDDILYTLDSFVYKCSDNDSDEDSKDHEDPLPGVTRESILLNYSGSDVCNGKFVYSQFVMSKKKKTNVIVAEIYNPNSFYLHSYSNSNNLNSFMASLQSFYDKNEKKYIVRPELLIVGLACVSRFEDSMLWHRAKILTILENDVQVLYVDYGSIELIPKSNVRLLASQFSVLPVQAIHCGLFEDNGKLIVLRETTIQFAAMVDGKLLEAEFKTSKDEDPNEKKIVTLYLRTNRSRININEQCFKDNAAYNNGSTNSIRRNIVEMFSDDE